MAFRAHAQVGNTRARGMRLTPRKSYSICWGEVPPDPLCCRALSALAIIILGFLIFKFIYSKRQVILASVIEACPGTHKSTVKKCLDKRRDLSRALRRARYAVGSPTDIHITAIMHVLRPAPRKQICHALHIAVQIAARSDFVSHEKVHTGNTRLIILYRQITFSHTVYPKRQYAVSGYTRPSVHTHT